MLATCVRDVPHMARARFVSLRGSTRMAPLSIFTATSSGSRSCRAPFGPFTFTVCPSTFAVTPAGTATALLPIRDICASSSEHGAEDFAANIGVACVVIGHHALRRRQDGDTETIVDARQCLDRHVDSPAWLRHPRNLADHRLAVEILELDLQLAAAVAVLDAGVAADVAFTLEHLEHTRAQLRAGGRDLRLAAHLRVADAGEHVAERIVQSHRAILLTSSTSRDRESAPWSRAPAARCGSS